MAQIVFDSLWVIALVLYLTNTVLKKFPIISAHSIMIAGCCVLEIAFITRFSVITVQSVSSILSSLFGLLTAVLIAFLVSRGRKKGEKLFFFSLIGTYFLDAFAVLFILGIVNSFWVIILSIGGNLLFFGILYMRRRQKNLAQKHPQKKTLARKIVPSKAF